MLTRILGVSLLAGVLAGLLVAGVQLFTTVPLILKAEVYEKASETAAKPDKTSWSLDGGEARIWLAHGDKADGHAGAEAWEPGDGLERSIFTSVATVGTAVGFSLMLLAVMLASGVRITARTATLWGLGAFIATGLAPSLGLPPELPGSAAAALDQRQLWWLATASLTALGIWLMFQRPGALTLAAGAVLIVAPHVVGAPQSHEFASTAPAELAGHFASASLAVHALLWTTIGATVGYFWSRSEPA